VKNILICGIPYDEFSIQMEEFHGYRSPGILLGGLMLDAGLREVGPTPYLNVVSETVVCLPDAVQLLTPCTFGNGFLQVLDWGKFAVTVTLLPITIARPLKESGCGWITIESRRFP